MSDLIRQSQHLKGPLREYFSLDSILCSTRSADLYKAIDQERDEPVLIWVMRDPLPLHSNAAGRLLAHIQSLQQVPSISSSVLFFGIDAVGHGFGVLPPLDGQPLDFAGKVVSRAGAAEPERRFMSCVKALDQIHRAGVVCGDLCVSSFWVDRNGDVQFIGILGAYDADLVNRTGLPPLQTVQFLPPDQTGTDLKPHCDVFALGVLGFYLFSGQFPYGEDPTLPIDPARIQPLSTLNQFAPIWAEEVLRRCVSPEPDARFSSATELLAGISESRQRALDQAGLPSKKNVDVTKGTQSKAPEPVKSVAGKQGLARGRSMAREKSSETTSAGTDPGSVSMFLRFRLLIAVVAVFVVSLFIASRVMSKNSVDTPEAQPDLALHRAAAAGNPEIQSAIEAMGSKAGPQAVSQQELTETANRFENLVASDDPLAHVVLVKSAVEAKNQDVRSLAERALVDRVRRLGMLRSAEQLRQWLRTVPAGTTLPGSYEPLLKALNATLPAEARQAELRKAYVSDPRTTLRLAASLALDSSNVEEYQGLISQLVGDALGLEGAADHSALALILAHTELAVIFGDDVVQKRTELPDKDVIWLLEILGNRNDFYVRPFASLAVERGILPPLRRFYLSVISEHGDSVPPDVLNAMVRASAGALLVDKKTSVNDIASIGQWENQAVVKILLVVCADVTNNELLVEAFDTLAARSIPMQPVGGLIDWVRRSHWDKRGEFAHAVGILGNLELVDAEQAHKAFEVFEPYLKDSRLVNLLLTAKDERITQILLEKYAASFDLGTLLNLLDYDDVGVRKLAVPALGRYNDIGAIKIILEHFSQEKDESVRQVYRDTFWFVREREQKQAQPGQQ